MPRVIALTRALSLIAWFLVTSRLGSPYSLAGLDPAGQALRGSRRGVAGAGGLHAGAMDRVALLGLSRLCALWAALLALFPCGAQGNWM